MRCFLAAVLVLLVPGSALLAWLPANGVSSHRRGVLSFLADAIALSIAIPSLIALVFFVIGLRVGGLVVFGLYGLALVLLLARVLRQGIHLPGLRREPGWWAGCMLALVFLAALVAWRFYQARTLVLPAWVDSLQHTLIVRKIVEYGGLPPDLSPYLSVPFFYHYGFHLVTALFAFMSGASPDQAVLWFGQVVNAVVALSAYRAAEALAMVPGREPFESGRMACLLRRIFPVIAALLVGFDFQMPAYYLTWGRYTLLTGLVLLGPALAAVLAVRIQPRQRSAQVTLVLLIAGICVAHYFVLLLVGLFLLVIGLFDLARGFRSRECWLVLVRLAVLSMLGILLASPWLFRILHYDQAAARVEMVLPVGNTQQNAAAYLQYFVYLMGPRRNHILMVMAGVGALAALLRARLRPLVAWALLLGLLSMPWGLRLGPFRPDHFAIILFFPAALLLAELLAAGVAALSQVMRPGEISAVGSGALALSVILFLAWGLRDTGNVINSGTVFTRQSDVAALQWVKENTPPTARFYINSTFWQGSAYRGVDGGYWLLPYTGRYSLVPPISYTWGSRAPILQVNDWAKRSENLKGCTPDFWNIVHEASLNYVYLRQGQGSLQPGALADCPNLKKVYEQGGVFIYAVNLPR